eukprot:762541-Hanusia_phi.AAC.1
MNAFGHHRTAAVIQFSDGPYYGTSPQASSVTRSPNPGRLSIQVTVSPRTVPGDPARPAALQASPVIGHSR